jgi:hypothetical protein
MSQTKCEVLKYLGFGIEQKCGEKAIFILDNSMPVCEECAKYCHISRLSRIP